MGNIVEMHNIVKKFGTIVALRGVNFYVGENEIVGLVGDNGAGKSTLVKILFGIYAPDEGEIIVKGRRFRRLTPKLAYELGIVLIHQERTLCEDHPIWRNVFMGRELTNKLGFLRIKDMKKIAQNSLAQLGLTKMPIDAPVKYLSGGYKQGVQISRALITEADLVILDEPTVALSLAESQKVLEFVREIKNKGKSAIFISHNIYHVYPVADRFVILDRGRVVAEFYKKDLTPEDLSEIMISIAEKGKVPEKYQSLNLYRGA
ncbi:MAG: ATP-binding cassette domain-containing protein [Thermoprotei archaeon]